jgi:hypothetical protein
MSLATYSMVQGLLHVAGITVTALVAASALVVAFVLTVRRSSRLAAWLLFAACGASLLLALLYIFLPIASQSLGQRWGMAGLQWAFVIVSIVSLGVNVLFGTALLLFRREVPSGGDGDPA